MISKPLMACIALELIVPVASAGIWNEDFSSGLGRFTTTSGQGSSAFVHNSTLGTLDGTFVRRDIAANPFFDRRLALLDSSLNETDSFGFSVEWSPFANTGNPFPRIGFFDSNSFDPRMVLAITDGRFQLEVAGDLHVEDTGDRWIVGSMYKIDLQYAASSNEITVQSFESVGGVWNLAHSGSWTLSPSFAFSIDSLGIGGLSDDHGFTSVMEIRFDNFAFVPPPPTVMLGAAAMTLMTRRRRHTNQGHGI